MRLILFVLLLIGNLSVSLAAEKQPLPAAYKFGLIPGKDVQLKAFKSVDSCFQQVLIGAADACVTPPFAVAVIEEKMNLQLRTLLKTPSIPNLSIVVHSRVPAGTT